MSQSDKQIFEVIGGDDEEVGGGGGGVGGVHSNDKGKKQRRFGRNFRRAKQVVLSSLSNAKKKLKKPHQIKTLCFSSSSSAANASLSGTKGCCFCFKKPHTLGSPVDSDCSDPNDANFSYDMLKSLIEKNDFYSKESNPHLDF